MVSSKTRIVIIGGGIGAQLAHKLSPQLDISRHELTLINNRPFFTLYIAGLRMNVTSEQNLEDKALIPFDRLFAEGHPGSFKLGSVTAVRAGEVVLESGETVGYDHLVLATGNIWEGPLAFPTGDKSTVVEHVKEWRSTFASKKDIAIIGGGAVGLELAGEIKQFYPQTNVTVVHNESLPLNSAYPNKFRKTAQKALAKTGIKLVLEDRLEQLTPEDGFVTTKNGVKVKADLVVPARGGQPNTSFLQSLDASVLTPRGHVKVLTTLQVDLSSGKRNIWALGDIIEWPEQKQIAKGEAHIAVLVANLLSALNGKKPTAEYKTPFEAILVTNGVGGYGYLPFLWGIQLGDWMSGKMKSRELFIPRLKPSLGY
jgi:NADH dehydrogenase FAD-containing subunit